MQILTIDWAEAWTITGVGIGIVFVILILLVFILDIFDKVVAKTGKTEAAKPVAAKPVAQQPAAPAAPAAASDLDMVAVATAIHLYYNESHDEESGVLTIKHDANSLWHFQLKN
ncbi:MAG: OadG family protein [Bacteroidaceae bacterium]|nr:OadG family protein [Bacteroidaceae bacterium]